MNIFDDNISIEKYTMDHPVYIEGIDYPSRTSRRMWPPPLANRQVAIPEMYPQNYMYGGVPSAMIGERETTIRARPSFVRRRKKSLSIMISPTSSAELRSYPVLFLDKY